MKTSPRSIKLASSIHSHLSSLFSENFSPNEFGFLTIVKVEISGDLGVVDVFIRTIGKDPDLVIAELKQVKKKVAQNIGRHFKLRRVPTLRFKIGQDLDPILIN
jgi:ribosome-binding factor A